MKYLDENGLLYLVQKIKTWLNGKASSSHTHAKSDIIAYTDYELPTASTNTLGGIKVGSGLEINNGVLSTVADNAVNNLVNYYLKSETYNKEEIQTLISAINSFSVQVVDELPAGKIDSHTIFLIPKESEENDNYDEYIYINNTWEHIGSTSVDLTGYATETWVSGQISKFLNQSQIQSIINTSLSSYYSKTQVDDLLVNKANTADIPDTTGFINKNVSDLDNYYDKDTIDTKFIQNTVTLLDVYPIGSVYISVNNVNPATLFGGNWEQIEDRFLLASGNTYTNGTTGGSSTHKLTEAELPKITGVIEAVHGTVGETGNGYGIFRSATGVFSISKQMQYGKPSDTARASYPSASNYGKVSMEFGGGQNLNIMPPFLTVYMWKRVS